MDPDILPVDACLQSPTETPQPVAGLVTSTAIYKLKMADNVCNLERFLQDSVAAAQHAQEQALIHKRERSQYASAGSIAAMTSSGSGVIACGSAD
jgi:hypothetical protein